MVCYTQVFDHRYEKFAFWIGPSRTGKSTAKNVHEQLLGKENVSNVGLERFGTQFGLEESVGRLLNIAPDVGTLSRVAEGNIKALVSGDRISFDRKYEKAISVELTARLQFLCQRVAEVEDRSDAIFDRLLVIAFENTIPENQRDRRLKYKLFAELPGIFSWSMEGLRRLRQQERVYNSAADA